MIIKKYQLVEFVIPQAYTQYKYTFQDQPFLRGVQVLGLEIFSISDMALSPAQNPLLTIANLQNAYLTLYTNDPDGQKLSPQGTVLNTDKSELIQNVPALRLRNMETGSAAQPFNRRPFEMAGQTIAWDKSFITFSAAIGNAGNAVSLLLGVTYQGIALT